MGKISIYYIIQGWKKFRALKPHFSLISCAAGVRRINAPHGPVKNDASHHHP
jgi:hypothetical protein